MMSLLVVFLTYTLRYSKKFIINLPLIHLREQLKKYLIWWHVRELILLVKFIKQMSSQHASLKLIDCQIDPLTCQPVFMIQITGKKFIY